jgi:hypothetical protein
VERKAKFKCKTSRKMKKVRKLNIIANYNNNDNNNNNNNNNNNKV